MFGEPAYRLVTAAEFLEFSFSDRRAELDRGVVRVLDGVTARHAMVQGNLLAFLKHRLRGSDHVVFPSMMPVQTGPNCVRIADLTISRRDERLLDEDLDALTTPTTIFELYAGNTTRTNLFVKLEEYKAISSVEVIVFVDVAGERLRVIQQTGPNGWSDVSYEAPVDLILPSMDVVIPHDEIFARD